MRYTSVRIFISKICRAVSKKSNHRFGHLSARYAVSFPRSRIIDSGIYRQDMPCHFREAESSVWAFIGKICHTISEKWNHPHFLEIQMQKVSFPDAKMNSWKKKSFLEMALAWMLSWIHKSCTLHVKHQPSSSLLILIIVLDSA